MRVADILLIGIPSAILLTAALLDVFPVSEGRINAIIKVFAAGEAKVRPVVDVLRAGEARVIQFRHQAEFFAWLVAVTVLCLSIAFFPPWRRIAFFLLQIAGVVWRDHKSKPYTVAMTVILCVCGAAFFAALALLDWRQSPHEWLEPTWWDRYFYPAFGAALWALWVALGYKRFLSPRAMRPALGNGGTRTIEPELTPVEPETRTIEAKLTPVEPERSLFRLWQLLASMLPTYYKQVLPPEFLATLGVSKHLRVVLPVGVLVTSSLIAGYILRAGESYWQAQGAIFDRAHMNFGGITVFLGYLVASYALVTFVVAQLIVILRKKDV